MKPPKPTARPDKVSLWRYARLFRADLLSAQPARLYRAWMAEFRTPFFRSFLLNQPDLVAQVLRDRPGDFPKSARISEGLRPLLGQSVFLTNGETWQRQRRIIDPAFAGGRLRDTFPAMQAAAAAMVERLTAARLQKVEIEEIASHAAADVIFRTLFSIPIEDELATRVFALFRDYQRSQPILNIAALLPLPRWVPRFHSRKTRRTARQIRALITQLTDRRMEQIEQGNAPDDLATKIMTTPDPETGACFSTRDMVDQVAIFFLAGHETSASALSWALYLLALYPEWQDRVAAEAQALEPDSDFAAMGQLKISKDVFREAMRLYPPVPMMVREATCPQRFRDRDVPAGAQLVLSPWHLHRHTRLWQNPDDFDPDRWTSENGKQCQRTAYIPFSAGPRACPGAGFAMIEGPLLLSTLMRQFRVSPLKGCDPVPVAHLTVRARDGIFLQLQPRT
ncbi:cytochrome P450 [Rhodobacteraceae bacterium F11138]|nr:cytochrome P450 [Rhodobacteraceae bacterium F11138]